MGPIWGRRDPGWPNVGPMDFALWEIIVWHAKASVTFSVIDLQKRYIYNIILNIWVYVVSIVIFLDSPDFMRTSGCYRILNNNGPAQNTFIGEKCVNENVSYICFLFCTNRL